MRKRILFVSYTADWTGPTNSLLLLLKNLRNRYDVSVLLPGHGLFSEAVATQKIPFFSFPSLGKGSIPAIARLIRRQRFDLVYGNNVGGSSRNALIAAKLARVPFICHVREMATGRPRLRYAYLNLANAVVPVSQSCSEALGGRVANRKLRVVHNGIDLGEFGLDVATARQCLQKETGIPPDSTVWLNVGHLKPMKGQHYAVEAFAQATRRRKDVHLLLVGSLTRSPEYVGHIKTMIGQLGLVDRVQVLGFRKDTLRLVQAADLCVHSSLDEAHPRAVLEAMAAGLPVVAFAVDGVRETVVDGKTGYLVRQGDVSALAESMSKLTNDRALRMQLGLNGRRRVEQRFSAISTADKVAHIIEETLNGAGR